MAEFMQSFKNLRKTSPIHMKDPVDIDCFSTTTLKRKKMADPVSDDVINTDAGQQSTDVLKLLSNFAASKENPKS